VTTPRLGAALGLVAEVAREPTFAPAELDACASRRSTRSR
jgi:predicted Zn-dependent peptidase